MTKRAVLSGYFGFKNFGDEAILSLLVNKLQSLKYSVTVISSNPDYTKAQFKHIRCVKTFDISNIAGFILKSDVLISGGGSLLQDVTSLKSLIYYLFIIFLGIFFNKKVEKIKYLLFCSFSLYIFSLNNSEIKSYVLSMFIILSLIKDISKLS